MSQELPITTTASALPELPQLPGKKSIRCKPSLNPTSHRLLILADKPRDEDLDAGEPYTSGSGAVLRAALSAQTISTSECCIVYTSSTDYNWQDVIHQYKPNCILAVGDAFEVLGFDHSLHFARGAVIPTAFGCPAVGCYDPLAVCAQWKDIPYLRNDVAKAAMVAKLLHAGKNPIIKRHTITRPTFDQAVEFLTNIYTNKTPTSFDIEGYPDAIGCTMIGFSVAPDQAFVIPFWVDGKHYWSETEEVAIWSLIQTYLGSPIPKTAHNCFYELFVLAWRHRLIVRSINDDTMMMFWELYVELEKALDIMASFFTFHTYWKGDRESDNSSIKLEYNATDCYLTEEGRGRMQASLTKSPKQYEHYRFNISLIPAFAYLNIRGCKLSTEKIAHHIHTTSLDHDCWNEKLHNLLAREGWLHYFDNDFNCKSTKDKQTLLYDLLGCKESKRKGKERTTDESKLILEYSKNRHPILHALIRTIRKRTRLSDIEKLTVDRDGRIRTALSLVNTDTGRTASRASYAMRPTFKVTKKYGKEFDGWENTGTNLQNVTKELRDCLIPDDGHEFWQLDLAGADGWTVAADLANLGYPTMLEDYLAGIKPAKVLMLLLDCYESGGNPNAINSLSRTELKQRCKDLVIPDEPDALGRPGDWRYMVCKKTQHGTNYDAKPETIASLVFDDSDGLVDLTSREAAIYQHLYKLRYRPELRNQNIKSLLAAQNGVLHTAVGISRKFFSLRTRVPDDDLVRTAAALEPQAVTTGTCNIALHKLWFDPANRLPSGWLRAEPLLQIHDALAGQYCSLDRQAAHRCLRNAFDDIKIRIGKTVIAIPADGGYGSSWKDTKHELLR